MINKSRVMGNLGGADGAVLRCLDILNLKRARHLSADELNELMDRLEKAHESILTAAKEIEDSDQ